MKVLLFGATGHLGRHVLEQALDAGHIVTAFVRRPEEFRLGHDRLRVVPGDVLDGPSVAGALPGQDAVLSALGPRGLDASFDVLTWGTRHIVSALPDAGVRRVIAVAAAGILQADDHTLVRDGPLFPDMFKPISAAHWQVYETLLASGLDWTLLCPPRLTDGALTRQYRVQAERALDGGQAISTRDAAHFMLSELAAPHFVQARVAIAD